VGSQTHLGSTAACVPSFLATVVDHGNFSIYGYTQFRAINDLTETTFSITLNGTVDSSMIYDDTKTYDRL
jgi:hypothetical protein